MSSNAVDELRARTGAGSDAALARMLGKSSSAVARWRQRNRIPASALAVPARRGPLTIDDLRKAFALLPTAERRLLLLELMQGSLGR